MEETTGRIVAVTSIQPRHVFGLRAGVRGNIQFTQKQEVIYPVESVLAIHDFTTNKQKFLRFAENVTPEVIEISPNLKYLAVVESGASTIISIYALSTLKRCKTLTLPADMPTQQVQTLAFTHDSKGIAVLSKEPDAFLALFFFDKNATIITGRVSNHNQKGQANYISCNLNDSGLVAIGGDYTLKIMSKNEKSFGLIGTIKGDRLTVTSLAWLTADVLLAGTADQNILLIEGGDLKMTYDAQLTNTIDITQVAEPINEMRLLTSEEDIVAPKECVDVNCLKYFPKGFVYALHNVVHVFEKESADMYFKRTLATIPMTVYEEHMYKILNVAINAQQDTIIVSTLHSQIYIARLIVSEQNQIQEISFNTLGEPLHAAGILSMSTCSWKPIVMTSASDQTIRIWNYESCTVELVKKYQVNVNVIGLHPSGLFAAVGFADQMRLMEILLDDLKIIKTFNLTQCRDLVFSHKGHLLAAAHDKLISIISIFEFAILRTMKGHNGNVLRLAWSANDGHLISTGADGAVYEWNVENGVRVNEVIQKGIEYRSVVITQDLTACYTVTNTGLLREIVASEVTKEIKTPTTSCLTSIALARSDLVMFIGSAAGHLYNVQLPFLEAGGGTCVNYRFFYSSVTTIKITYDDTLLAVGSSDGTVSFWTILNNDGKVASVDSQMGQNVDVMIPRQDLIGKNEIIRSLERRMEQQVAEFQYKLKQGDAFHSEQLRDVHADYCKAIKDLKDQNQQLSAEHIEQFNVVTADILNMKEEHEKALLTTEAQFQDKIIMEYKKSLAIKEQMNAMRDDYDLKLRNSAGHLQQTIELLENDFKRQLQERENLIRQLTKEQEVQKLDLVEYCRQVEIDNDRQTVELKLAYENRLKDEQEQKTKVRSEAGVLTKKLNSLSFEREMLSQTIESLKEQQVKLQNKLWSCQKDIEDLRKDIEERDQSIQDKERQLYEMGCVNQELMKYKQVLNYQIDELKAQIDPRERQIKDKKDQIVEMEHEVEDLERTNATLELQLSELKQKYGSVKVDLKLEQTRSCKARQQLEKIRIDIFRVSANMEPDILKRTVTKLYHKYGASAEIKKSATEDSQLLDEILKQRDFLETKLADALNKLNTGKKTESTRYEKLLRENISLASDNATLRSNLQASAQRISKLEAILGPSSKC